MTTRQTPDAVREASWTGDPHKLAAELRRVASVFDPTKGFRMPQLLRDAADEIDCLAALDSRAGNAGEVVWRRTALDAAKDCQRVRHSSATPQERDDALRQAATMLRSFADAATPAPAVDAVPAGEVELPEAARLALMYLETGHVECPQCGNEVPTKDLDAVWQIKDGLAALSHGEGRK